MVGSIIYLFTDKVKLKDLQILFGKISGSRSETTPNVAVGLLSDATKCVVTEERNGTYELEMEYPKNGTVYKYIKEKYVIICKPNMYDDLTAFRIYDIKKEINGKIVIKAYHISYDLNYYIIGGTDVWTNKSRQETKDGKRGTDDPFYSPTPKQMWDKFFSADVCHYPNAQTGGKQIEFTFKSDVTARPDDEFPGWEPTGLWQNLRSFVGGDDNSLLTMFEGELYYKNFGYEINFLKKRGSDGGVVIEYGDDMKTMDNETSSINYYDGVMPVWSKQDYEKKDSKGEVVWKDDTYAKLKVAESIVWRDATNKGDRVYLLDLSSTFDDIPTADKLKEAANNWLKNTDYSEIKNNIKVTFVNQYDEDGNPLKTVKLCDDVTIKYTSAKINTKTNVIKTTYNVLNDKYDEIELGSTNDTMLTALSGLSNTDYVNQVDVNKSWNDKHYRITEVTYISNDHFSVTAVQEFTESDAEGTAKPQSITNVFCITEDKDTGATIFTNTTNGTTITFSNWP